MQTRRIRNTSTGVEKTFCQKGFTDADKKHLHGRGEDLQSLIKRSSLSETPPRAWRRLNFPITPPSLRRNTSTGVEKTC